MNFRSTTLTFTLIFLFLASATSQRPRFLEPINKTQTISNLNSSNLTYPDQFYLDGCAAIMQGMYTIYDDDDTAADIYATWESQYLYEPINGYFDHHDGVVRERWTQTTTNDWKFSITLYDGKYVDQKYMTMSFFIGSVPETMNIDKENGTFQTPQDFIVNVNYGVNGQTLMSQQIRGQLTLFFVNKDTGSPITDFYDAGYDIKSDTVQITFIGLNQSFTFTTSLFYRTLEASQNDLIMYAGCALGYIFISLFSYYTAELSRKVTVWSVRFSYISSFYILIWMIFQLQIRMGILYLILLVLAFLDCFKQVVFVIKKDNTAKCLTLVLMPLIPVFFASAALSVNIWFNLFPSLPLILPLLYKMGSRRNSSEPYLTRFQISNWLCMSIWMGYTYMNPYNLFLFTPQPILAGSFFGIIFLQFLISFVKDRRRQRGHVPLLQAYDPLIQPAVMPRPGVVPPNLLPILNIVPNRNGRRNQNNNNNINNNVAAAAAQRRGRASNQRANNNQQQANKPKKKMFKYTFAAGGQEDYTLLTDECAICFDYLLGETKDKLYKTPCGHLFHEGCLRAWGVKKLDCPCCRKKLPKFKHVRPNA